MLQIASAIVNQCSNSESLVNRYESHASSLDNWMMIEWILIRLTDANGTARDNVGQSLSQ